MHTIITPLPTRSRKPVAPRISAGNFRAPSYDCQDQADALKIVVYIPGAAAAGVEIEAQGSDLTVTARKEHFVRVNFGALHLENVQRDYQLRLRLGHHFEYGAMEAEIHEGVLTITLPKKGTEVSRLRRVA